MDKTIVVHNEEEFLAALSTPDNYIVIAENVTIDMDVVQRLKEKNYG